MIILIEILFSKLCLWIFFYNVFFFTIKRAQFPLGDKLPANNLPVSQLGPVSRDQREQELDYFLTKQYNELGMRIQTKLNNVQQQIVHHAPAAPTAAALTSHSQSNTNLQATTTAPTTNVENKWDKLFVKFIFLKKVCSSCFSNENIKFFN